MKWWKACAISACISQGLILCLAACWAQLREEEPPGRLSQRGQPQLLLPAAGFLHTIPAGRDGAMPVYLLYKIFPRIWKKSYIRCFISVRRLLAHESSNCFSYLFWRESSFFHQICICRSMLFVSSDLAAVVRLLSFLGNLPPAASLPYHRPCFLPCLQDAVLHKIFETNTRDNSEELI